MDNKISLWLTSHALCEHCGMEFKKGSERQRFCSIQCTLMNNKPTNKTMEYIKMGTKVIGNWGAMHPTSKGKIVGISQQWPGSDYFYQIMWDGESEVDYVSMSSIHQKGYRSVNGSPIGIFIDD